MSDSVRGAIYGLTASSIWGGMYVISDVVLVTIPPFTLLSIRLILAALILGIFLWQQGNFFPANRAEFFELIGIGLMGYGISLGAQFVGTDQSTAVNGALITSASPAFILVFAAIILREHLTPQRIAAVALATFGVIVIIDLANADFSSSTFRGDVALAVAAITWGLYSVLVRRVSSRMNTLKISFYALIGGLIAVIPAAVFIPQRPVGEITIGIVLGVLYLGVISTAAAMWLWNRSFALVDASVASLFFFAQPLVGALLGVILLGQNFTTNLWIGSILIIAGVLLAMVRAPSHKTAAQAAE